MVRDEMTMIGFALDALMAPDESWRRLVRDMVRRWPQAPILELPLTLAAAADAIESQFEGAGRAAEAAARGYKLAALLSLEIHAMKLADLPRAEARDLLAYWKGEPYFTRL